MLQSTITLYYNILQYHTKIMITRNNIIKISSTQVTTDLVNITHLYQIFIHTAMMGEWNRAFPAQAECLHVCLWIVVATNENVFRENL